MTKFNFLNNLITNLWLYSIVLNDCISIIFKQILKRKPGCHIDIVFFCRCRRFFFLIHCFKRQLTQALRRPSAVRSIKIVAPLAARGRRAALLRITSRVRHVAMSTYTRAWQMTQGCMLTGGCTEYKPQIYRRY